MKCNNKVKQLFVVCSLSCLSSVAQAANWSVCTTGGCDYTDPQSAINGAAAGDTIDIGAEGFWGAFVVDKDLTIAGAGETVSSLYGGGTIVTVNAGVTATITDLKIYAGMAYEGGGIYNSGDLTLKRVNISDNFAVNTGGGIWTEGPLSLDYVTVHSNGVDMSSIPAGSGAGIYISWAGPYDVSISNSVISENIGCNGGGIFNDSQNLTIFRSQIINNEAGPYGLTCPGYLFNDGGGLMVTGLYGGLTQIKKSTISGNVAAASGGGVASLYSATITMTNSTISGNESAFGGSAISTYDFPFYSSTIALNNTTVTNNNSLNGTTAISMLGGIFGGNPSMTFRNSIMADQFNGIGCSATGAAVILSDGYNLESDTSCNFTAVGDIQNSGAMLDVLANNGGLTETHAPLVGSPVINAGNANGCQADMDADGVIDANIRRDQRGQARARFTCDMGSHEL